MGYVYDGLPGLMWVNHFDTSYMMEPDFHIPKDHIPINHGVRLMLSETPNDEKLSDSSVINILYFKIYGIISIIK